MIHTTTSTALTMCWTLETDAFGRARPVAHWVAAQPVVTQPVVTQPAAAVAPAVAPANIVAAA